MPSAASPVRSSAGRPGLATVAAIAGLLGALATAWIALLAIALGGWSADDGSAEEWLYLVLALAAVQAWAAVRLLRRRGWLPLVLACLPGIVLLGALVLDGGFTLLAILAALPVLALVLASTPIVRRWAAPEPPAG